MRTTLIALIIFGTVSAWGSEDYRLYDKDLKKYKPIKMIDYKGRLVSEDCQKKTKMDCLALNPKPTKKAKANNVPLLGHPASDYCAQVNGKSRILFDKKNDQYDFCLFEDGSMTESWSLYNKRDKK